MKTVKKNDFIENPEFEKLLKDKMNELSENVDCFEKISERAYSSENAEFSDSEFTVTDLENVTGKRSASKMIKWGALAACAVLCIGVLPKTNFIKSVFSDLHKETDSKLYEEIADKIINVTADSENYRVYDLSLDEYIKKDVLVTPMYCCPFEDIGREDIRVRLFVRTVGDAVTNELYAVEYCGEYAEANFIAAAESEAAFTEEDYTRFSEIAEMEVSDENYDEEYGRYMDEKVAAAYISCDKIGRITNKDGNGISAASFSYQSFFKEGDEVLPLISYVFYCHDGYEASEEYRYDMLSYTYDTEGLRQYEMPDKKSLWKASVYCDGTSAMPGESGSDFTKADYFDNEPSENDSSAFVMPFSAYIHLESDDEYPLNEIEIHKYDPYDSGIISLLDIPDDILYRSKLKIYVSTGTSFLDYTEFNIANPYIASISKYPVFHDVFKKEDVGTSYDAGETEYYVCDGTGEYFIFLPSFSDEYIADFEKLYPELVNERKTAIVIMGQEIQSERAVREAEMQNIFDEIISDEE